MLQTNQYLYIYVIVFSRQINIYAKDPNINANIFFANADTYDTTLGLAYVSEICSSKLKLRIGIVEWNQTDIHTGEVSSIILSQVRSGLFRSGQARPGQVRVRLWLFKQIILKLFEKSVI
jgi:hypothetical protein